jgi:hypothetical protein
MITHDARRSLSHGNNPVPSPRQATRGQVSGPAIAGQTRNSSFGGDHYRHTGAQASPGICTPRNNRIELAKNPP